jgi:hypothetical protein
MFTRLSRNVRATPTFPPPRYPQLAKGEMLAVALAGVLAVCACGNRSTPAGGSADSTLRAELIERGRADQAVREVVMEKMRQGLEPDSTDVAEWLATDSANTGWLKEMVGEHGWPDTTRFGAEAAGAAFLIVQHSPDTGFQREMLPLLRQAVEDGEANGQELALLTDRLAVQAGHLQVYGTQAEVIDGKVVLHAIEDSAGVDQRRAELGLPPLADYVRLLDSAYTGRRP